MSWPLWHTSTLIQTVVLRVYQSSTEQQIYMLCVGQKHLILGWTFGFKTLTNCCPELGPKNNLAMLVLGNKNLAGNWCKNFLAWMTYDWCLFAFMLLFQWNFYLSTCMNCKKEKSVIISLRNRIWSLICCCFINKLGQILYVQCTCTCMDI